MNYLAIFVLVIVVVFLTQKKELIDYEEENISKANLKKIEYVKENIEYIYTKGMSYKEVTTNISKTQAKYVFLTRSKTVSKKEQDTVIYNFVLAKEIPCGFNAIYYFKKSSNKLKNIFLAFVSACINYIQMLHKEDLYSHYFLCMKKEEAFLKKVKMQSFEFSWNLCSEVTNLSIKEFMLKNSKLKLSAIFNFFFVILAGVLVTANVIYNLNLVISRKSSVISVVTCALIYVCYANILGKVYSPMGKFRFIASYLFPLYIVVYVISMAYYYIRKVVGEICVNKKKSFLLSLIILLIVYVMFILLKQ